MNNQGLYTCVANGTVKPVTSSNTAFLNVVGKVVQELVLACRWGTSNSCAVLYLDPQLFVSAEPAILLAQKGAAVVLTCNAQGHCPGSKPDLHWTRQNMKALNPLAKVNAVHLFLNVLVFIKLPALGFSIKNIKGTEF